MKSTAWENSGLKSKSATAFWLEGGKVKYTFNNALISANKDSKVDGWDLAWTSNEVCSGKEKFTFTVNAVCKRDSEKGAYTWLMDNMKDVLALPGGAPPAPAAPPAPVCAQSVKYEGPEVCKLMSINVSKFMRILMPFWNLILIGFGITMTFWGGRFMF